jgi:hypothetical protein
MSTTRDKLSLSSDTASKKNKIPKLKEVEVKVRFDISKDTLLDYQHAHRTNSHYLPIKFKVPPDYYREWNEPIGQHIMVNCLRKDIKLSYEYPANGKYIGDDGDEFLLHSLEAEADVLLSNEIGYASNLIDFTKKEFVPSLVNNTLEIASTFMDDPTNVRAFPRNLIVKSNDKTFFKWRTYVQSHVDNSISKDDLSYLNTDDLSYFVSKPKKLHFIDLDKLSTLACLLGNTFLTDDPFFEHGILSTPHFSVTIKGDEELLYQNLVKALIEQTSCLLQNITREPVGFLFKDSVSQCIGDFNRIKRSVFDHIDKTEKIRKKEKDKAGLEYAKTLIDFTNNQRLKLTLEQGFYWRPIYFEVLTETIKRELFTHISDAFRETFINNEEFYFIPDTKCDFIFYSAEEYGPNSSIFFEEVCTLETNTPSELALLLNASVKEFFVKHPLISKFNIVQPKNKILMQTDIHDKVLFFDGEKVEFICIANYFTGQLVPQQSELILDVTRFKKQLCDGPLMPPGY